MTISGKKFIENIQNQWAWQIFWAWIHGALEKSVETSTEMERQDIVSPETPQTSNVVQKTAEWIVNSKVWQKLVWAAEKIWEKTDEIKADIGKYVVWQVGKIWTAVAKQWVEKIKEKELVSKDVYEDTAKVEKVAWVDESWQQYIKGEARKQYEAMNVIGKLNPSLAETFPQFWETKDWKKVYRTDWQYVVDQPVWYTDDLVWTLQDAYNSVTYAYANDWVVLTPDDLKKAYPEYANVSDWALANFISWCLYDVQRWVKSEIWTVADAMWELSLTEWYTNRMDSYMDILSDDSFLNYWIDKNILENEEWQYTAINAAIRLKSIVDYIKEVWAFAQWMSDWAILSTYRNDQQIDEELRSQIDNDMKILEDQNSHDGLEVIVANLYDNYMWNVKGAKRDLSDEDITLAKVQREAIQTETAKYRDELAQVVEKMRMLSENESRYPMKNFLEYTVAWKYVMDNKWNYYITWPLRKQQLAYSRQEDWTYLDSDWNVYTPEMVRAMAAGWIVNWTLWAMTSIADNMAEWLVDWERLIASGWNWKDITQYSFALASDIMNTSFGVMMSNPLVQLSFNAPILWPTMSFAMETVMDNMWPLILWMLQEIWVAEWWTTESEEKVEEMAWVIALMVWQKTIWRTKAELKKSPRYRAMQTAVKNYIHKLIEWVKKLDVSKMEKAIEDKKTEIDRLAEERKMNALQQQQWADTNLKQDVRAMEKVEQKIDKEAQAEKEKVWEVKKEEWVSKWTLTRDIIRQAKEEFFNEFYEEYKKLAWWEENMDKSVLFQKDINDMQDEEKKQAIIDKWNELYEAEQMKKDMNDMIELWNDLNNLKEAVNKSLQETSEKQVEKTKAVQGKKPTRRFEKVEKEDLKLTTNARESVRENPFRYMIKDLLDKYMEKTTKKKLFGKEEVIEYKRKRNVSIVDVQEDIISRWQQKAQDLMNKLRQKREDIFKFRKDFFKTDIDYDITDFFTNFLQKTWLSNILSRLIKEWEISIVEFETEDWEIWLRAEYTWKSQIPSAEATAAINVLNMFIDNAMKWYKDGKMLHNELSLYNLRHTLKDKWWNNSWLPRRWDVAMMAEDLYSIFNDYMDTYRESTGIWDNIRIYDNAFSNFFDAMDMFEWLFNKNWEIKHESRNRIVNIKREKPWIINEMDKLIPWTKEILDLVETAPWIVTAMITLMEKTDFKNFIWKNYAWYFWLALSLALFPKMWFMWTFVAVPTWEILWKRFKKAFKQRPLEKKIKAVMDQLEPTEAEKEKVDKIYSEKFQKTLDDVDAWFDELLRDNWLEYKQWKTQEWPQAYDKKWDRVRLVEEWIEPTESTEIKPTESTPSWTLGQEMEVIKEKAENIEKSVADELEATDEDLARWDKEEKIWKMSRMLKRFIWKIAEWLSEEELEILNAVVSDARELKNKWDYKAVQKKIDETTWFDKTIYTKILLDMMLEWTAPIGWLTIDPSDFYYISDADLWWMVWRDVWKQPMNRRFEQSTSRLDKWELEKEAFNRESSDEYSQLVKKWARVSERKVNKSEWDNINESNLWKAWQDYESYVYWEQSDTYSAWDARDEQFQEDVEKARHKNKHSEKTTFKDVWDKLKILEKEWERITEEVPNISKENIQNRENVWFGFDNLWENKRTRTDNKWNSIYNVNWKDFVDWWVMNWTAVIEWWWDYPTVNGEFKYEPTTITVSSLEVFDNIPQLEKTLPEETRIIDNSTNRVYSLDEVQRMEARWETNQAKLEEYYLDLYSKYPEEIQSMFAEDFEKENSWKTEKTQVQSSPKEKSETKETQAEQSSTENKKTSKSKPKKPKNEEKTPKEEFDEMYDSTPVVDLNIKRDRIDNMIKTINSRSDINIIDVKFTPSVQWNNQITATITYDDWNPYWVWAQSVELKPTDNIQDVIIKKLKIIEDKLLDWTLKRW